MPFDAVAEFTSAMAGGISATRCHRVARVIGTLAEEFIFFQNMKNTIHGLGCHQALPNSAFKDIENGGWITLNYISKNPMKEI